MQNKPKTKTKAVKVIRDKRTAIRHQVGIINSAIRNVSGKWNNILKD